MRINNIELLYMTDNESRATNVRNNFVPRAYNKPWPRFAVSRDEKNKKPRSIEMKRAEITEKLKADLEKMKKRINKEKKQNGGRRKTRKHKKRRKTRKYKKRKRRKTKRRR